MRTRTFLTSGALTTALLAGSVAPATAAPAAAKGPGVFVTNGDRVHISSTPPRTASAHAWWTHVSGPGTKAKVTIWLQMKSGKKWHSVARNAKNLKSGNGGSARRVVARKKCANRNKRQWRTKIDVDLIGVADSPEKAYTKPVTVKCGV
uniref:Secreted protein n=1 Tax=Streptomyces sp. NBC_00008 TaxID=2903610 RepID=A0AAU2VK90_9ACTN